MGTKWAQGGRKSEAQRTAELIRDLPPGITVGRWPDERGKPFFVRFGPRHDRQLVSYASEKERNDEAGRLFDKREEHGTAIMDFDPEEWRRYQDFRTRCRAPFPELESLWAKHQAAADCQLVKDAAPRYMALRLAEDVKPDSDTHRHMKLHLGRLAQRYGMLRLDELTADLLRTLLEDIVSKKTGRKLGPLARRSHRKDWNTFLKRAVLEEWTLKNPCLAVKPPKVDKKPKPILDVEAAFTLFKANAGIPVVGRLALEAFGACRASSAERMQEEHIKWKLRGLELTKADDDEADTPHKSGERQFRQGHPAVLWKWLKVAPVDCWTKINRNNYGHKKSAAFLRAGVKNTGNVLRHSCISYLLAILKSYGHVSYLAQHTKSSTTIIYEGRADELAAKMYLAITPEAVRLTWQQFKRRWRKFYVKPLHSTHRT